MKCVTNAWDGHEAELRRFLYGRVSDHALAEDLLQEVFLKALREGARFCALDNTRAWLFQVARNALIDYQRTHKLHVDVPDDLSESVETDEPVVNLSRCLPAALQSLDEEDREIIEQCDLDGMEQQQYAEQNGLGLSAAKSRIQRARKRLRAALHDACNVRYDEQGRVCCFDPDCS